MILTSPQIFLSKYDISGSLNKVSLEFKIPGVDDARFGNLSKVNKSSAVMEYAGAFSGFADADASQSMEQIGMSLLGTPDIPWAVIPVGGSVADVAYFGKALKSSLKTFGQHGENMPYAGNFDGSDGRPATRGQVLLAKSARTSSANSAITQLGAVTSTQRVYGHLIVTSVSGTLPTLDVVVKSSANSGLTSPTTRLTFTQANAATSELLSAAGAITDTYWRVDATIAGTNPSFTFAVLLGIDRA